MTNQRAIVASVEWYSHSYECWEISVDMRYELEALGNESIISNSMW